MTTERGDRCVLKKVSTFGAPDPVRRFTGEARILTHLLQRGVPVAAPVLSNDGKACTTDDDGASHAVFPMLPNGGAEATPLITRHLLAGYGAVSGRTWQENDDLPALALAAALGLAAFFARESDLVEESWLRTVHRIGDNFDAFRFPASVFGA